MIRGRHAELQRKRLSSTIAFLGVLSSLASAAPGHGRARTATLSTPTALVEARGLSLEAPELKLNPALVRLLRETPHNYFRFVNRQFSRVACGLFDDIRGGLPEVNLHGDVHIEQYAVTSLGRGLTDFDDSARGPYVIDLVRFGVSLELAAREKGWAGEGRRAFDDFLRGYRDALEDPSLDSPPVRVVGRARATFARDHGLALRRADQLMDANPVPASELEADFRDYVTEMLMQGPALSAGFFRIKKAGRLEIGIGSALDEKYLLRIEGRTLEEGDDEILEAKLVHPLTDTGCVHTHAGPQRVLLGMSLITHEAFPFSGLFTREDRSFWVHGWTDDYVELRIESSFPQPRDLRDVAYDVGIQLGRAHPKEGPGKGSTRGFRRRLRESTRTNEDRIRTAIEELTEETIAAWTAFRRESASRVVPARRRMGSFWGRRAPLEDVRQGETRLL
jgi:Uncharacterized protein conserved in bacteria (DUF2252)